MEVDQREKRLPYAAQQSEGQNACVVGPNDEIIVEVTEERGGAQQMLLAVKIADMLNDTDAGHVCNDRARQDRSELLLLIVRQNGLRDVDTIAFVSDTIDAAGIRFIRSEVGTYRQADEVPF